MTKPLHLSRHRPSDRHLRWLYTLGGALLVSGAGWLVAHYLLRSAAGPFGEVPHASEPWWLRLHGAAALGFLVTFGALLPYHVVHNWRRRQHYRTGLTVVIGVGLLTLTGYGLYYLVSDALRPATSVLHWIVGIGASLALLVHVVVSYRHGARAQRPEHLSQSGRANLPRQPPPTAAARSPRRRMS